MFACTRNCAYFRQYTVYMIYHILRYAVCNQMCTRCSRCKNVHTQHSLNATEIICTPGEKLENDRPKIPTRSVFVQLVYEVIHKINYLQKYSVSVWVPWDALIGHE